MQKKLEKHFVAGRIKKLCFLNFQIFKKTCKIKIIIQIPLGNNLTHSMVKNSVLDI